MASMTCNHVFGKRAGQNEGKRCSVKVSKEGVSTCSKHTPVPADQKKWSFKKWEAVMLPQIPKHLVKYYREERNYIHHSKLTLRTANNAAAWILVKYYGLAPGEVDFRRQMREALAWSDAHPINKMNQYFYEPEYMPSALKRDEKGFAVYMANHKYMNAGVSTF